MPRNDGNTVKVYNPEHKPGNFKRTVRSPLTKRAKGLRNRNRSGVHKYAAENKGRRASVYDRPLLTYRDPDLERN